MQFENTERIESVKQWRAIACGVKRKPNLRLAKDYAEHSNSCDRFIARSKENFQQVLALKSDECNFDTLRFCTGNESELIMCKLCARFSSHRKKCEEKQSLSSYDALASNKLVADSALKRRLYFDGVLAEKGRGETRKKATEKEKTLGKIWKIPSANM